MTKGEAQFAAKNLTIEAFASAAVGDRIGNVKRYGCFNRANFYVKFLVGVGFCREPHDGSGDGGNVNGGKQLEAAIGVLEIFSAVFVLEQPDIAEQFNRFLGLGDVFGHLSNNPYSSHTVGKAKRPASVPPPTAHYKETFDAANQLDNKLYQWATARNKRVDLGGEAEAAAGTAP